MSKRIGLKIIYRGRFFTVLRRFKRNDNFYYSIIDEFNFKDTISSNGLTTVLRRMKLGKAKLYV